MLGAALKHYQEFKEILDNYQISDEAKKVLQTLNLVVILGPSSGGRNTTIRYLLQTGKYHFIVSDTTRKPRINDGVLEENGREYWFRTEEEMLDDLKKGQYLEAEIIHNQQVSGISMRELVKAQTEDKIAIADTDINGVHTIVRTKKDIIVIMLLPPSFEEWQRRISARGKMTESEERRRLETAKRIFEDGLKQSYYHFVIADDIKRAAQTIDAIAHGQLNPQQGRAEQLIHRLQYDLSQKLETGRI